MNHGVEIVNYILLGVLLLLSFYFSGSEAAIFSLNRLEQNSLRETKSKKKKNILVYLLDNREQILITILTGNMVVNIFASSIGGEIGSHLFAGSSEIVSIIIMTLLLLLVGELTPKRIAVNHPKGFTHFTAVPLFVLHRLLTPLRTVLNSFSGLVLNLFHIDVNSGDEDRHALIISAAELGYNQNVLVYSEYSMFKSYLAFKNKNAGGVMTPRNSLKTLSCFLSIREVVDILENRPDYIINSSILLHKENRDHLYGWIPVSDLLECKYEKENLSESISVLSRNFHIVPQSKKLPSLIVELRQASIDIALLVDEYGGTAGILWFHDIVQNVLKVFYGASHTKLDKSLPEGKMIPGSMTMEDFQEFIDLYIETESETVSGFFMEQFGSIPVPGNEIEFHELTLKIMEMNGNKIEMLKFEIRAGE